MNSMKLLEAIGNIDDQMISEAAPDKRIKKKHINRTKYGTWAACLCLCFLGIWMFQFVVSNNSTKEGASAFEESDVAHEAETEVSAEAEVEAEIETEPPRFQEDLAEEAPAPEDSAAIGSIDIAYGFVFHDRIYYPISFEDRKRFGLVPEEDMGLTSENTYHITESDLGEALGTIEHSDDKSLIGATVYRFAAFPESDDICIVKINDSYEFYTGF